MNSKYLNDYELIYLISLGDDSALEQLIQKYKGVILHSLEEYKKMLNDKFDKNELYQISLIALYHAVTTFNENVNCSFFTYFKIVSRHQVLAYIRTLSRDRSKANLYSISLDQCVKESEGVYLIDTIENNQVRFNPEDYVRYAEIYTFMSEGIKNFVPLEQEIFVMWFEGYRYEEIATIKGVTCQHVSYVVSKIKKKLKALIDYKGAL